MSVNIAIIGYRDVCVCSHEELVIGLASSEAQLTGIFIKKKQLTSKVRSRSHQSGQNGYSRPIRWFAKPFGNEPST